MRRKKKQLLFPILIFFAVILLSIGGLILAKNLQSEDIADSGELTNQDEIPRITVDEAYQALQESDAIIIDTRSEAQYQIQHIAGAINIPLDQIEARMGELDPDSWIITYCT